MIAVPAAIAVAVLRYRLYEIDRLVDLTLVYLVLRVRWARRSRQWRFWEGIALSGGSTAPTAAATLAVAVVPPAAIAHARRWSIAGSTRRATRGCGAWTASLAEVREGRAEPEATGAVLAAAVSDPTLQLFFWLPRDSAHADARGRLLPSLPPEPGGRTPCDGGSCSWGRWCTNRSW